MNTLCVTGATSGFGQAIAEKFLSEGWQVIATGRRADRLATLKSRWGDAVHTAVVDMRDETAIAGFVAAIPEGFKRIAVLVNNAGLALGTSPAQRAELAQWKQMIDTNITGLVTLTHALLPSLIDSKALIVNISSIAATYPYTGGNVYGGTKAFVSQFSLGLRSDLHGTGVRVTSIEPGLAETEFTLVRNGGDQAASDTLYKDAAPIVGKDIADQVWWLSQLPPHLNINRLEVMPVSQSFAGFQIHRG